MAVAPSAVDPADPFPEAAVFPETARRKSSSADPFPEAAALASSPGPASAGFFESLSGVPEELGRFAAAGVGGPGNPLLPGELMRQAELTLKAESGDLASAKKLRAKGIAASTVASVIPVGRPALGVGRVLVGGLARRAALGAAGGAAAGGLEAAASGGDVVPAAASGAVLGGVVGGAAAGVGSLLARRAAERLAKAGKAATPELAQTLAVAAGPAPPTTPVQRVIAALKAAPRLLGKQEALRTVERGVRVARAKDVAGRTAGEEGFRQELGQMAGELPRVDFASLRQVVDQADVDALNEMVKKQPGFDFFDTVHAREGLAKLFGEFGGVVPSQSELKLLNKVFGADFVNEILNKRPLLNRLHQAGVETLGLSRSIMSTLDFSAPRQAAFALFSNPRQAVGNLGILFKHWASPRAFEESQLEIAARPTYELMKRGRLELTEVGPILSEREELFKSQLAERIPGLGKLIKASNRAFTGYLNRVRADVFDDFVKNATRSGRNVWRQDAPAMAAVQRLKDVGQKPTDELLRVAREEADDVIFSRRVSHFVNAATGRGDLPKWLEKNASEMAVTFFAPRFMSAHLTMLNPLTYIKNDPAVRKAAIRGLLGFSGTALGVMKLAQFAGADVETDIESPDWGKIKVGNTRIDILGGYQQYLRTGARLLTQWKSGEPADVNLRKNLEAGLRFGRTKLSPLASFAADFYYGKDMRGKDVTFDLSEPFMNGNVLGPEGLVGSRFTPMIMKDAYDVLYEWGPAGAVAIPPAMLGMGIQTYE